LHLFHLSHIDSRFVLFFSRLISLFRSFDDESALFILTIAEDTERYHRAIIDPFLIRVRGNIVFSVFRKFVEHT